MNMTTPETNQDDVESDSTWREVLKDSWRSSPELRRATFVVVGVPLLMAAFVAVTALVAAIRGVAGPMLLLSVAFHTALHPIDMFGFEGERMAADVARAGGMTGFSQAGVVVAVLALFYLVLELFFLAASVLVWVARLVHEGIADLINRKGA